MNVSKALEYVARQNGTTVEQVRTEIEAAIADAWENGSEEARLRQRQIPCKGERPTPEEFMEYCYGQLMFEQKL